MSVTLDGLTQMLYLFGEEASSAVVLRSQLMHLKTVSDLLIAELRALPADTLDNPNIAAATQRSIDVLEPIYQMLGEFTDETKGMNRLETFAEDSATLHHALYALVDLAISLSLNVRIDLISNRWSVFKMQLSDWRDGIDQFERGLDALLGDPRHNKAAASLLEQGRRRLLLQYPEPDIFHRLKPLEISQFHVLNESPGTSEEDADVCRPSGETTLGIFSGGVPVACKTISAANLKKGPHAIKEVADMYTMSDSNSSPYIQAALRVCFMGADSVLLLYPLAALGNLGAMLKSFDKDRRKVPPDGTSANEMWLTQNRRIEGKLSVVSDVLAGLSFLHSKGIVHGRLRPSNVLVLEGYRARLVDFGVTPFLKQSPSTTAWLESSKSSASAGPIAGSQIKFNEFVIGEDGIRWMAPEQLFVPSACLGSYRDDFTNPRYYADVYSASMIMYYSFFEKKPFFNIVWNEGVYNMLVSSERPLLDMPCPDCEDSNDPLSVLFGPIELAWSSDPHTRMSLRQLRDHVIEVHQQVVFEIETRTLDFYKERLQQLQGKPAEMRIKLSKDNERIAKGEAALARKKVELENALNNKQRREFQSQLEKGRGRLDVFIAETKILNADITSLEAEIKSINKSIRSYTERRYGGPEHILRHRAPHKDCLNGDQLLRIYKGPTPKSVIDDAVSSSAGGMLPGGSVPRHALQTFFFNCGDKSKTYADEMLEYRINSTGHPESCIIESSLVPLFTFAAELLEQEEVTENDIPRFAKSLPLSGPGFPGTVTRQSSIMNPMARDRADSETKSEMSDKSDPRGRASSMPKKREGAASPTHTDASEESDFWRFETAGAVSGDAGSQHVASEGEIELNFVLLPDQAVQYLAAYRGCCEEALGLVKVGRGLAPELLKNLSETGETPVYIAAQLGHLAVLRNLLEHEHGGNHHLSPHTLTKNFNRNALHSACIGGCARTVKYLVDLYDDLSPEEADADGMSPIHHAVARGHLDTVTFLLQRFDSLSVIADEVFNATLLHWAAGFGKSEILKYLLQNNPEITVNARCCDGSSALMWAVASGDVECTRLLVDHKADIMVFDKKGNCFEQQAWMHNICYPSFDALNVWRQGQNFLHLAALNGSLPIVRCLSDNDLSGLIGQLDNDKKTPLMLSSNPEVTAYLKQKSSKRRGF